MDADSNDVEDLCSLVEEYKEALENAEDQIARLTKELEELKELARFTPEEELNFGHDDAEKVEVCYISLFLFSRLRLLRRN